MNDINNKINTITTTGITNSKTTANPTNYEDNKEEKKRNFLFFFFFLS
jgi:hypothetical protein